MKKIVVNGSFDLLHVGHLKLLEYARSLTDSYVYVLIDSDDRIRQLKGHDRPVNGQYERKLLLESLKFVDSVEIFYSDEDLENKIKKYEPDIMVKGSDYRSRRIIGSSFCKEILFYERIDEYSTTQKIQDIIDRR